MRQRENLLSDNNFGPILFKAIATPPNTQIQKKEEKNRLFSVSTGTDSVSDFKI